MISSFILDTECTYNRTLSMSPIPRPCVAPAGGFLSLQFFVKTNDPIRAEFSITFDRTLSNRPYRATMDADFRDRSFVIPRLRLPNQALPIYYPDRLLLEISDFKYRSKLPMFELLSSEKFFEYITMKNIEQLGYQTDWLNKDNRRYPNLLSIFKSLPPPGGEVFHVECLSEGPYTTHQIDIIENKFQSFRNRLRPNLSKLLIIPIQNSLDQSYYSYAEEKSISVLPYPTLIQLVKQVERGYIEKQRAYELLLQSGEIRISNRIDVSTRVPDTIKITYSFYFK